MKRRDLVKRLEAAGWRLKPHTGIHDTYTKDKATVQIPRHREIKENTARQILKDAGIKP